MLLDRDGLGQVEELLTVTGERGAKKEEKGDDEKGKFKDGSWNRTEKRTKITR